MLRLLATLGFVFLLIPLPVAAEDAEPVADIPAFGSEPVEVISEKVSETQGSKPPLNNAVSSALSAATAPFKKVLSWGGHLLKSGEKKAEAEDSEKPEELPSSMRRAPLKIRSIQYLAEMDDASYPHIIDTLLASLDDTNEDVRYEALRAVYDKCSRFQCRFAEAGDAVFIQPNGCDCLGCRADQKVLTRLNAFLLDRKPNGSLREQSTRVRDLAMQTLFICLKRQQHGNPAPPQLQLNPVPNE